MREPDSFYNGNRTMQPGNGGCRGMLHVVEQGDTLYLLGRKYHVSVSSIMYANPYVDVYNLQVGDELCIPRIMPMAE